MPSSKEILIELGLDTKKAEFAVKELEKNFKSGQKQAVSFQKQLRNIGHQVDRVVPSFQAMGIAILGAVYALKQMGDSNKEIKKVHEISKVSLSTIQELTYAMEKMGFDVGEVLGGIEDFITKVGEGNQDLIEGFKLAGVTQEEIYGKSSAEMFEIYLTKVAAITDEKKRLDSLNKVMATDGVRFNAILSDGADGLARLRKEAHDTGAVLSDEVFHKVDEFNIRWKQLNEQFSNRAINALVDSGLLDEIEDLAKSTAEWLESLDGDEIKTFIKHATNLGKALVVIRGAMFGAFVGGALLKGLTSIYTLFISITKAIQGAAIATTVMSGGISAITGAIAAGGVALLFSQWAEGGDLVSESVNKINDKLTLNKAKQKQLEEQVQQGRITLDEYSKRSLELLDEENELLKEKKKLLKSIEDAKIQNAVNTSKQVEENLKTHRDNLSTINDEEDEKEIEKEREKARIKKQLLNDYERSKRDIIGATANFLETTGKKGAKLAKKIRLAELGYRLFADPQAIFAEAVKQLGPIAGPPVGGVLAALTALRIATAIRKVKATPAYRSGGIIGGVGTATSDSNVIKVSRNEEIVSEADRVKIADKIEELKLQKQDIHINIDGKTIARASIRAQEDFSS